MDFMEIATARQSCRSYDETKMVEREKLDAVLEAARLAPSACNGQPYHLTVLTGEKAKAAAKLTVGPAGMNKFAVQAPVMIVMSEEEYVKSAGLGAKIKNNDYRSMDIGIAAAYLTAQAASLGLGTCILGWFDDKAIREICAQRGVPVIDLFSINPLDAADETLLPDGLHPNDAGHRILAQVVADALLKL